MSSHPSSWGRLVAALLVGGSALGGCPAAPAGPPPADYAPGEVHRDPAERFTLTLPAGWAHQPEHLDPPRPENPHTGNGPPAPEAAFIDRGDPGGAASSPRIEVRMSRWARDLRSAVESNRVTGPYGWESLTVDEPVLLVDGTPAHLLAGTLPPTGSEQGPPPGRVRTALHAVSDGWLVEVDVEVDGEDAGRYGPGFFDTALRTLTVAGDPPPGPWPWQPVRYADPAGRFSVLVPPRFELDPALGDPDEAVFVDPLAPEPPDVPRGFADPRTPRPPDEVNAPQLKVLVGDHLGLTLREAALLLRLGLSGDGDLLVVDEPLVLADGTPAHLMSGVAVADGTFGVQTTMLVAMRDGVMYVVRATADRALLAAYPPDVFDASARSLTLAG